ISVALGGGGSRGNSHVGVLRRLEKEGYRIQAVAGTSFGGIVAALYAAGYTPDQIEEIFSRVDQANLYARAPGDGPALLGLVGVTQWLNETLGERTFADLKIPCALTAVDLNSGQEIVLAEGLVKDAVLATIAVPGVFPSIHVNGWELVDGGVLNPVPVSVARSLAPGLPVVAVALGPTPEQPPNEWKMPMPNSVPRLIADRVSRMSFARALETYMRAVEVGSRALAQYRLAAEAPEVLIRPDVTHIDILAVVDPHQMALLGEEAVALALPELKRAVRGRTRFGRFFGGMR
ncbi:MAG: patatin-like phospholipase family protein, partial [Bacteroidota bacterium]